MSRSRDLANLANNATGLETLTVSDITDLTASATELNYVDGVGSALQTQINAKAPLASPTFTGTVSGVDAGHITTGTLGNTVQNNITRFGTVTTGTLSHGTALQGYVDSSNTGVAFPNGHVIQVVSFPYTTESNHTGNTSWASTGVEVDITPRTTSSKFFIIVNTSGYVNGGHTHVGYYSVFRDSTDLGSNSVGFANIFTQAQDPVGADMGTSVCFSTYDAPSGLSLSTSIKYEMYVRSNQSGYNVYWSMNASESTITVMEIAQ